MSAVPDFLNASKDLFLFRDRKNNRWQTNKEASRVLPDDLEINAYFLDKDNKRYDLHELKKKLEQNQSNLGSMDALVKGVRRRLYGVFTYLYQDDSCLLVFRMEDDEIFRPNLPENEIEAFLGNLPVSAQVLNKSGELIAVNPAYEKLWGVKFEAVRKFFDLEKNQQILDLGIKHYFDSLLDGKKVEFPLVFYDPSENDPRGTGIARWVKAFGFPLQYESDEHEYFVILHFDLTEFKGYEENLLEIIKGKSSDLERMEFAFQEFVDNSPDVIMRFDNELKHTFVSKKVEDQTGIKVSEFIGKSHKDMNFPPDLVEIWEQALEEVLQSGRQNRITFKLPNDVYIDWYLFPDIDIEGKVTGVMTTAREITDLKLIETELNQSRKRLEDALTIANLAVWEHDLVNDVSILNKRYCDLVGIDFESLPNPLAGLTFLDGFVHSKDKVKIIEAFKKAAETRQPDYEDYIEFRIKSPKYKSTIIIYASVRVIFDSEGNSVKAYGTIQDVTQFRRAEQELLDYRNNLEKMVRQRTEELKNSRAKLQDALEIARLATWEFDFETKSFSIGPEFSHLIPLKGKKRNISLSFDEFSSKLHPDDVPKFEEANKRAIEAVSEDFQYGYECRLFLEGDEIIHLYISIRIQLNSEKWHTKHYGTIQDITSIKKIEAERERLNSIIDATSDFVAIGTPEGNLAYINDAGQKFTGISTSTILNREEFVKIFSAESVEKILKEGIPEANERGIWKGINEMIDSAGHKVPVSQVVLSHKNSDGKTEYYSTIIRDISEQKKIEKDLVFKNNELDTFVYSAGHDLKGPIASLKGLHSIIEFEVDDKIALDYFEKYHKQILRLDKIVQTLLELTKIKEREILKIQVDVEEIIAGCIEAFSNFPNFENIEFDVHVENEDHFESDENLIRTIVQNLIENSIKYCREDTHPRIRIFAGYQTKNQFILQVEDNGVGIKPEYREKIFNMFFRGNEKSQGSGLGLYILKNAVDKLGGVVLFESEVNHGTTFTVNFPVS